MDDDWRDELDDKQIVWRVVFTAVAVALGVVVAVWVVLRVATQM